MIDGGRRVLAAGTSTISNSTKMIGDEQDADVTKQQDDLTEQPEEATGTTDGVERPAKRAKANSDYDPADTINPSNQGEADSGSSEEDDLVKYLEQQQQGESSAQAAASEPSGGATASTPGHGLVAPTAGVGGMPLLHPSLNAAAVRLAVQFPSQSSSISNDASMNHHQQQMAAAVTANHEGMMFPPQLWSHPHAALLAQAFGGGGGIGDIGNPDNSMLMMNYLNATAGTAASATDIMHNSLAAALSSSYEAGTPAASSFGSAGGEGSLANSAIAAAAAPTDSRMGHYASSLLHPSHQAAVWGPVPAMMPSQVDGSSHAAASEQPGVGIYLPCDDDSLSEYQCLVRKQIELFEAEQHHVESNAQGRNRPIVLGQVGIRCRHCKGLTPKHRARGAVYYPAKLEGLYQAAQNMAGAHLFELCQLMPAETRAELVKLRERKSSAGGGKKYWADGVRVLGVYEDEDGLRFGRR